MAVPSSAPGVGSLPSSDFAGPNRSYPINTPGRARDALSRSSGKSVNAQVKAAVHAKYPEISISGTHPSVSHQSRG